MIAAFAPAAPASAQDATTVLEEVSVAGDGRGGASRGSGRGSGAGSRAAGDAPGGLVRARTDVGPLGDRRVVETPFSTSGFTEKLIRNVQAQTLSDVIQNDPSVTVSRTRGTFFDIPYIRGFPIGNSNLLFNGVPSLLSAGVNIPVEPFERIDILKGPAAFFYGTSGFAGVGGAINLVTKRAPAGPLNIATLGYASQSLFSGSADVARRWGNAGEFGLRINGAVGRGESNVDDLRIERALGSLAFDWQANERLRVSVDALYSQFDIRGYQNGLSIAPIGQLPFIPKAPKLSNSITQPWAFYPTTLAIGVAKVEYDIADDWVVSAAYGYSYTYRSILPSPGAPRLLNTAGDIAISPSYGNYGAQDPSQVFTGTLRGRFRTGELKHELIVTGDVQNQTFISTQATILGSFLSNIYRPRYYPRPAFPPDRPHNKAFDSQSYGVGFTDIVSTADDRFFVLGGGRYSAVDYSNYNPANGSLLNNFQGGRFNPIGAVGFRPTPDSLIYANYAEAFEKGGVAPVTAANPNVALPPLTSYSAEVGAKAEFAGLIGTIAFFQIDKGLEYLNSANRFVQDGRQIHRGMEVLLAGEVTPAFRVIGGFQLLDPTVKNPANPLNEGNDPIGVARFQSSLFLEHDLAFLPGATVNAGVYHYSRQFVDLENARTIPDWTRLDLGARYAFALSDGLLATARFQVENVFDTNYWSSVALGSLSLGTPRTYKLSLQMAW